MGRGKGSFKEYVNTDLNTHTLPNSQAFAGGHFKIYATQRYGSVSNRGFTKNKKKIEVSANVIAM